MNVRDSEVICGLLTTNDYRLTTNPEEADIIIFNTCSVRQHAEDKVWSEIGRIAKKRRTLDVGRGTKDEGRRTRKLNAKPIIGLVGCMAQNYKEAVFQRAPAVDFVVGPGDIHKIPSILEQVTTSVRSEAEPPRRGSRHNVTSQGLFELKIWEVDGKTRPSEIYHTGFYEDKDHAYVVISEGCSNYCSYCVVPFVRGELHNRDYKDILQEIEEAVKKGITRITLLGQNVNAYRSPGHQVTRSPVNFVKLLKLVNTIKGLEEFGFVTSHPKDTSIELFKVMAECDKLKKYLHLPVQSGSDRILKLMNRGYTKEQYLDLIKNYRELIPGGKISTDIIVGFPTESEKDFSETYALMREVKFDSAYLFKYSPRPNTAAAKLTDDVPKAEKERRHKILLDFQKELHHINTDSHR
jgi:tRNA-2-methylthio-N6-dimethylallyladenosine synthase